MRFTFGGDLTSWAFAATDDAIDADDNPVEDLVQLAGGVGLTFWTDRTGGTQYEDLVVNGNPASQVTTSDGTDGREVGSIPEFLGPDGVTYMWADAGNGRYKIVATNLGDALDEYTPAESFTQHLAERNPHSTRVVDLADVDASSPQIGQVLAVQAGGTFGLSTVAGTAPVQSVDGMTGEVDLSGSYVPRDINLTQDELQEPLQRTIYDHVPATNATDLEQVYQTQGGQLRLTWWRNERGYIRAESQPGSHFDNLFSAICAASADETHGWPYQVERRNNDNSRDRIGGLRWDGRVSTALHPWEPLTVDPDETGNYVEAETPGTRALQARLETDDIIRLQGRITASEINDGDAILEIPTALRPLSSRLVVAVTDTGLLVPLELTTSGRVEVRGLTEESGPHEISIDDITYVRIQPSFPAAPDTFAISTVAVASPGSSSPLTISGNGTPGRLYVVIMSTEGAQTATPGTVTDNGGNTWTLAAWAPTAGGVGRRIEMHYTHATNAFSSVSVPIPGGQTSFASLLEITGHDPAEPIDDAVADVRSSSTTPAALEITPSAPGQMVLAAVQANPNTPADIAPDQGWITLATHIAGHEVAYQINPPDGDPIGVAWTFNSSAGSGHVIAVINPAP